MGNHCSLFLLGKSHGQRNLAGYHPSIGSQRVRQNWVTEHLLSTYMYHLLTHYRASAGGKHLHTSCACFLRYSDLLLLKLNIQKTKFMAPGPIISWQIDGETMETVRDFILLGSKITVDSDYSHKIKRCLLLGRKAVTNLDNVWKSTFLINVCIVKAMFFSSSHVWMWELDHKEPNNEELIILDCGVGKDSWESLRLQGDQTSQS